MDNLQAAILNYRLQQLDGLIEKRRKNAQLYFETINVEGIRLPFEKKHEFNTYHTFVIQIEKRDELKTFLANQGIETAIHYPTPIHIQPAAKTLDYKLGDFPETEKQAKMILTLPINQFLNDGAELVSDKINNYYRV